jgi:hypothetical protein
VDEVGDIVPRHSLYYLVPREAGHIQDLCEYLNSNTAVEWLMAHCQRAANGFIRLQSHILKRLPVPDKFVLPPTSTRVAQIEEPELVPV